MELSHNVTITVPRFRDSKRVNTQTQLNTRTNTMMNFTFTNTNSMAFNVVATYNALFISIFPFVPFISTILLVAANFYCISFFINIFALAVSSIIFFLRFVWARIICRVLLMLAVVAGDGGGVGAVIVVCRRPSLNRNLCNFHVFAVAQRANRNQSTQDSR